MKTRFVILVSVVLLGALALAVMSLACGIVAWSSVALGAIAALMTFFGVMGLQRLLPRDYYGRDRSRAGCSGVGLNQRGTDFLVWVCFVGPLASAVVGVLAALAHDAELVSWPWTVLVAPFAVAVIFHGRHLTRWRMHRKFRKES